MSNITDEIIAKKTVETCRLMNKDGSLNVMYKQLDWGNPLKTENAILMKWKPIFLLVIMTFFGFWLFFALAYWLMEMINCRHVCHYYFKKCKDCVANCTLHVKSINCVVGVHDFSTALLFSIETMTTIGYGSRALTENCPFVIFLATVQSLLGVLITGIMTGLVMSKFKAHVMSRKDFIWFSKKAVVFKKIGMLCLAVTVSDRRDKKLKGVSTTAVLVTKTTTKEGEVIPTDFKIVMFGIDKENENLPFFWPICIAHMVDNSSPLHGFNPEMIPLNFELLIWVTGATFSGGLVQACTSYLPRDLVWGGKFDFSTVYCELPTHITLLGKQPSLQQDEHVELAMDSALDIEMEKEGDS